MSFTLLPHKNNFEYKNLAIASDIAVVGSTFNVVEKQTHHLFLSLGIKINNVKIEICKLGHDVLVHI